MSMKLTELEHRNIDQQVYNILTEQIMSGALSPGERITEEWLAQQLGVSRTPVREAMKALAKDDLVELLPRRGMYVKKLTKQDISEIYEMRASLEALAASLATPRISNTEIEQLKEQGRKCRDVLPPDHMKAWLSFDSQLHSAIVENCGNKRLIKTLASLGNLIRYFRNLVADKDENRALRALEYHWRILDAIEARDPERVKAEMEEHILNTREYILRDVDFDL